MRKFFSLQNRWLLAAILFSIAVALSIATGCGNYALAQDPTPEPTTVEASQLGVANHHLSPGHYSMDYRTGMRRSYCRCNVCLDFSL